MAAIRLPFITVRSRSADETDGLGRALGDIARPGDILLLMGDLGTGKTTLVKGLAGGLETTSPATSPSYTIMHTYEGRYPMLHVDLYRCSDGQEVVDIGLEEMLGPPWVVAIEWGEKAGPVVADDYLEIELAWSDQDGEEDVRVVQLRPFGRWRDRMDELTKAVSGLDVEDR